MHISEMASGCARLLYSRMTAGAGKPSYHKTPGKLLMKNPPIVSASNTDPPMRKTQIYRWPTETDENFAVVPLLLPEPLPSDEPRRAGAAHLSCLYSAHFYFLTVLAV
jgi:hypothetical protein